MQQFQFVASTQDAIVRTGGVEVESIAEAVTAISNFMQENNTPFEAGHSMLLAVEGFPPLHMLCSGQTTQSDGKVIPTWKMFSNQ